MNSKLLFDKRLVNLPWGMSVDDLMSKRFNNYGLEPWVTEGVLCASQNLRLKAFDIHLEQ